MYSQEGLLPPPEDTARSKLNSDLSAVIGCPFLFLMNNTVMRSFGKAFGSLMLYVECRFMSVT